MCGINGFLSKKSINNKMLRIANMNDAILHRGPDAGGVYISKDELCVLGHRRLAIVDLDERSNQPFLLNNGDEVIVFNGEIYNYKELREKLQFQFKTKSDTEVLTVGLLQKGIEWIKECNGMFAFCYYDDINKTAILCRDRMGIKPLYYYLDSDVFVFSSEIKGILNSGLVKAEFNYDAIDEYLGNRYVREPYTFFKNIYQVPAGTYITIDKNLKIEINKYWDLPSEFNVTEKYDEDVIYSEFKKKINNAISRRMIADVNVGTYLSGGVDSSLISAVTSQKANTIVNTYTIGFPELNEFEYAQRVADMYKTNHHNILIDRSNYLDLMEEIISYKDAPLGVPNEIPLALMSKILKDNITVVLSGEGADELLGGYGKIFRAPFDYANIDKDCNKTFYQYFVDKYEYVPRKIRDKYLSTPKVYRKVFDEFAIDEFNKCSNEEAIFRFFHRYHVKGLLQRVDVTTMYASVEARVPFLDHELIEFCYKNVPYNLKLRWNSVEEEELAKEMNSCDYSEKYDTPKYLLRKYGLELLPRDTVDRIKVGFPVPLNQWIGELTDLANSLLSEADWLEKNVLEDLLSDCEKQGRFGQILWMFINIEIFKRKYFDREWRY